MRKTVAAEFQALIKCAVDADHADEIEDDVLAGHVFVRWRAGNGDLDRFWHLQPGFTADHCSSDVGAAHAGGKCAHCAIGAGVAVGADDELTSANDALLRQEAMLNAHFADFIIMLDLVRFREIADGFALLRALDVLRRRKMVGDHSDLRIIKNGIHAHFAHFADGHRSGDIVRENHINFGGDKLTCVYFWKTCVGSDDLLCHCHSHISCSPLADDSFLPNAGLC